MIRAYHASRGEAHRDVCLIPASAHGTNPASAQMAGHARRRRRLRSRRATSTSPTSRRRPSAHRDALAAVMVTYPSTHGVFEAGIVELCDIVHAHGGQVYVDGANLNALVGLAGPGHFGADVSHLNLHKTFCIPHGGGGPGVGPVACSAHLAPFLPGHRALARARGDAADGATPQPIGAVSAAPYGCASILPISWMYIDDDGRRGPTRGDRGRDPRTRTTSRERLAPHYPVLYSGPGGLVAHECILDLRPLKATSGIEVEDVAKRLMDYGFHAPTMSFPVPGTLMVEPTESESKVELDRFIDAMIAIRAEIRAIEEGRADRADNPLKHAPHTARDRRRRPLDARVLARARRRIRWRALRAAKYWPPVARVDNVYGDRNLFCSCVPVGASDDDAPQRARCRPDARPGARRRRHRRHRRVVPRQRRPRRHGRRPPARRRAGDVVRQRRADLGVVRRAVGQPGGAAQDPEVARAARTRRCCSACAPTGGSGAGGSRSCSSACRRARATTRSSASTSRCTRATACRTLRAETGIEYDHLERGILQFYTDAAEFEQGVAAAALMRQYGCDRDVQDGRRVRRDRAGARAVRATASPAASSPPPTNRATRRRSPTRLAERCAARGVRFRFGAHDRPARTPSGDRDDRRARARRRRPPATRSTADAYVSRSAATARSCSRRSACRATSIRPRATRRPIKVGAHRGAPTVSLTDLAWKIVLTRLGDRAARRRHGRAQRLGPHAQPTSLRGAHAPRVRALPRRRASPTACSTGRACAPRRRRTCR